jgi:hypothetical protein
MYREFWLENLKAKKSLLEDIVRDGPINIIGISGNNYSSTFLWYETDRTENDAYNNSSSIVRM